MSYFLLLVIVALMLISIIFLLLKSKKLDKNAQLKTLKSAVITGVGIRMDGKYIDTKKFYLRSEHEKESV
jgi:predicted small secreted protein